MNTEQIRRGLRNVQTRAETIRDVVDRGDDVLYFAMVDAYLRDTVHPEDIAESLMCLARHGDSVEQSLSAEDRF